MGAYLWAFVSTGTTWATALGWLASVSLGLFLPGLAVTRAARPAPVPLVVDLGWAGATGLVVALIGWVVDRLLPWSVGSVGFGVVVTLVLLAVPRLRPRLLARPGRAWGRPSALASAAGQLVAVVWMLSTALRGLPPRPGPSGFYYIHDMTFQLAMTGEMDHGLVPTYPMVAGEPLSYHWFVYAIQNHLSVAPGVDRMDVVLRLMPATLFGILILLAAAVAAQLAERPAAGPVAILLVAVLGNSTAVRWVVGNGIYTRWNADGGALEVLTVYWQDSPPAALGWVAGVALLGLTVAVVRGRVADGAAPTLLLLPMLVLAAGGKSSQVPVLITGLGLALCAAVVLRRWQVVRRVGLLLLLATGVFLVAARTIYAAGSYGLTLGPGIRLVKVMSMLMVGIHPSITELDGIRVVLPGVAVATVAVVYLLPLLPRLVGLALLMGGGRRAEPALWIPLGTLIGGVAGTLLTVHPSGSEVFFLVSAYPVALVGSAAGLALGLERAWRRLAAAQHRLPGVLAVAGGLAGLAVACVVAYRLPVGLPAKGWAARVAQTGAQVAMGDQIRTLVAPQVEQWTAVAVAVAVLAVLAGLGWRRGHRWRDAVALLTVATALGTGGFTTWLHIHRGDGLSERAASARATAAMVEARGPVVTTGLYLAGRYVQRHAGMEDVVATNRYCQTPPAVVGADGCAAIDFTVSALTGRRVDVSGWGYATRAVDMASSLNVSFVRAPFWDRPRLEAEQQAIAEPTARRLGSLYADVHVRWIVADSSRGPVGTAALDRLAIRRFASGTVGVWQLRPPTTAGRGAG